MSLLKTVSCLVMITGMLTSTVLADDGTIDLRKSMERYAEQLQSVQEKLTAGEIEKAQTALTEIKSESSGIEWRWLKTRLQALQNQPSDLSSDEGEIQKLDFPEGVQSRYGILHPAAPMVVFICRDGSLRRIQIGSDEDALPTLVHAENAAVYRGAFSEDGKKFISTHQNGDVVVRNTDDWKVEQKLLLGDRAVSDLSISADGLLIAATGTSAVELWKHQDGQYVKVGDLEERYRFGNGISVAPNGSVVATGGYFDVNFWDPNGKSLDRSIRHASYTMGLMFSRDGKYIASAPRGNVNKLLAIYDAATGTKVSSAGPFKKYLAGLAFSNDGRRLVATGCENCLRIFDVQTGVILLTIPRKECGAEPKFSADGNLLGWSERSGYRYIQFVE